MTTEMTVQDVGARDVVGKPPPRFFAAVPTSMQEAMEMAKLIANSNLVPKAFQGKPGDVLVAMMWGAELEVAPFQALQNIAVINGRPTVWGDLVVALVQRSGKLEYLVREWDEAQQTATVKIKRKGFPEAVSIFSMNDAKRANLAGKDTYRQYPQRMCMWRALTFAVRNEFSDVLKGMSIAEEAMDFTETVTTTATPIAPPKPLAQLVEEFQGPAPQARQQRETAPREPGEMEVATVIEAKKEKDGKTGNRSWTRYAVKLADGRELTTFSSTVFEIAQGAATIGSPMFITTKPGKEGQRDTLETIAPATGEDHESHDGEAPEGDPDGQ